MKNSNLFFYSLIAILAFLSSSCQPPNKEPAKPAMEVFQERFTGNAPQPKHKSPGLDYDWAVSIESFIVARPWDYNPQKKYGLLVFMSPADKGVEPPKDWLEILRDKDLLYIAAENNGNTVSDIRRQGLGVVSTLLMQKKYNIDPSRIFVAGMSGGARTANAMVYRHPEIYKGLVAICGACFIRDVPLNKATHERDVPYTVILDESIIKEDVVKKNVRFALITGTKDFRYGHVLDIFNGGYQPSGYQAKFFDVPDMGHSLCSGPILKDALDYIEL